jgi:hypothetical protein
MKQSQSNSISCDELFSLLRQVVFFYDPKQEKDLTRFGFVSRMLMASMRSSGNDNFGLLLAIPSKRMKTIVHLKRLCLILASQLSEK